MIPLNTFHNDTKRSSSIASAAPRNLCGLLFVFVVVVVMLFSCLAVTAQVFGPSTSLTTAFKLAARRDDRKVHNLIQAAYQHAAELQQHTQQQQQEHQQQQLSLAELKQQHQQQSQVLSTMQEMQDKVQAGVQKMEKLYEQLNKSTTAITLGGDAIQLVAPVFPKQQQQQQPHGTGTQQGVLCTLVRNEARYVPEWLAFHLLMGATQIVLYNDNSTDSIKEAVAPFGDRVVLIDMKQGVDGVPGDLGLHRQGSRQDWAFRHCKTTYAPKNGTGWFGIWDVDEFVFPCMRPGVQLLGANVLWDAYTASTKAGADGHALHCSIFGQNHDDKPQGKDMLVLVNNIRRAAHPLSEPVAAPKAGEAVAEGCNKCGCCHNDFRKTIYNMSSVAKLNLGTHGPFNEAVIDNSWQKPLAGLCCNHYQFKSTEEAKAKAASNLNPLYDHMINTPDGKKHYTMLEDMLIWQYLPDLMQLLQQKGFEYKMPEVPVLIKAD